MSKAFVNNDGYLALLDAVYFDGKRMGNLSEEGLKWGGQDPQKFQLFAAQVRGNPVMVVQTRAATNELTGKMIELVADNCIMLLGGRKNPETGGWIAPANATVLQGPLKILTGTGQTIDIKQVSLSTAYMRGGLGGEQTLGIQFGMDILTPSDGSDPYSIDPTEPFIEVDTQEISFTAEGGRQALAIETSGPFSVKGKVPDGFGVEIINGRVTVIADPNETSAQRSGVLTFVLQSDVSMEVNITLTQSA